MRKAPLEGRFISNKPDIPMLTFTLPAWLRSWLYPSSPRRKRAHAALARMEDYIAAHRFEFDDLKLTLADRLLPAGAASCGAERRLDRFGALRGDAKGAGAFLDPPLERQKLIASMPPITRAILILRIHHGMSVAEIAELSGVNRAKIRRHLRSAIRLVAAPSASRER